MIRKKQLIYFIAILVTIPLGLASRWYRPQLPFLIAEYGGDVLAATCIFFGVRLLLIRRSLSFVALISYLVCIIIEVSQLYRAPWLVRLRDETPMGILLGHGFLWSDWLCYAVGVLIALLIGWSIERRKAYLTA